MKQIKEFISSLQLPVELHQEVSADDLLQKHQFYLHLAQYLAPAFPAIARERLTRLTGYSYLYFRFLLGLDSLLDEKPGIAAQPTSKRLFGYLALHEQAVRGLAQLFAEDAAFWPAFEQCKHEYAAANLLEKQLAGQRAPFSLALFEQVAAGKSAVSYAMAYALASLSAEWQPVPALQQCLRYLHIAAQCLDDVEDFRQDWESGQFTYAHSLVEEYLAGKGLQIKQLSIRQVQSYFYTSGAAQQLLQQADSYYTASLRIAQELGLEELADYLGLLATRCQEYQKELEWLLQKTAIKARKSTEPLHVGPVVASPVVIRAAINYAVQHLRSARDAHGRWTDFMTSAGPSVAWVTAYVGLQLAETPEGSQLAHDAFDASFALPGAYNESMAQDGDSLSFAIGLRQRVWGEADARQLQTWLAHLRADGGWATYCHADRLRSRLALPPRVGVEAWLAPHACVTAAAACVLHLFPALAEQYQASCAYLAQQQQPAGCWHSYWWTSPIYATSFAVRALAPQAAYRAQCQAALHWLMVQQLPSGAWAGAAAAGGSAFYTALAIQALLTSDQPECLTAAELGVGWLLSQQTADGSWPTARVLRIPATDVAEPAEVKQWRPSSFGVNVVIDDHNRVFTTSTALNALSVFSRKAIFTC